MKPILLFTFCALSPAVAWCIVICLACIICTAAALWYHGANKAKEAAINNSQYLSPMLNAVNILLYKIDNAKDYKAFCEAEDAVDTFIADYHLEPGSPGKITLLCKRLKRQRKQVRKLDKKKITPADLSTLIYSTE